MFEECSADWKSLNKRSRDWANGGKRYWDKIKFYCDARKIYVCIYIYIYECMHRNFERMFTFRKQCARLLKNILFALESGKCHYVKGGGGRGEGRKIYLVCRQKQKKEKSFPVLNNNNTIITMICWCRSRRHSMIPTICAYLIAFSVCSYRNLEWGSRTSRGQSRGRQPAEYESSYSIKTKSNNLLDHFKITHNTHTAIINNGTSSIRVRVGEREGESYHLYGTSNCARFKGT